MIEREFIAQKTKEFYIKKYIEAKLKGVGISQIRLKKIPLGEKIIILTSKPSLIVGSKGANIRDLTKELKQNFKLENPQIEINEVKNVFLDANIVADRIASSLERFGSARFKSVGHKIMENVMNSGALGIEVLISGKIPGARAKSWRFYQGYLKKCGDAAVEGVRKAKTSALLKTGIIGIQVAIMPPDLILPDHVTVLKEEAGQTVADAVNAEGAKEEEKGSKKKSVATEKSDKGEKTEKKKSPAKKKVKEGREAVESKSTEKKEEAVSEKEEQKEE